MKDTVLVEIERLTARGDSLGIADSREVVTQGALPGERVHVRIEGGGDKRSFGPLVLIERPSLDRVAPPCSLASACGGCSLQHMHLEAQRDWKEASVQELFREKGLDSSVLQSLEGPEEPFGFRAKAQFMIRPREGGGYSLGLFATRTNDLIALDECMVQDPVTADVLSHLSPQLSNAPSLPGLRGVLIRSNGAEALLTWLVYEDFEASDTEVLEGFSRPISLVKGVFLTRSSRDSNVLLGDKAQRLFGEETLEFTIGEKRFRAGPTSFVQTSLVGAELLVKLVRDMAPDRMGTLVDLYGGTGMFALALSERAERVVLVERDTQSAADAKRNLEGIGEVICGDAASALPVKPEVLIVDPPRAGLNTTLVDTICNTWKPEVLLYVSCNPRSFVRDAAAMVFAGYRVEKVVPVDLFPHTTHVELVAKLVRVN